MPNYQNGKIYSIRSRSQEDLVYVGSTTQSLALRFGKHKRAINKQKTSSKQIIDIGDAYIELIENYPCDSKEELHRREGQIIRSMDCVNKVIPGRTLVEYRIEESEKIRERGKQYYKKNADSIKTKTKKYWEENKGRIAVKKNEKFNCGCGGKYTNSNKNVHSKTQNHQNWLNRTFNPIEDNSR